MDAIAVDAQLARAIFTARAFDNIRTRLPCICRNGQPMSAMTGGDQSRAGDAGSWLGR
jgi:hypothetical protein